MTKAKKKDPAAVALGRKGGKNSRKNLTPEKRTEKLGKPGVRRDVSLDFDLDL